MLGMRVLAVSGDRFEERDREEEALAVTRLL